MKLKENRSPLIVILFFVLSVPITFIAFVVFLISFVLTDPLPELLDGETCIEQINDNLFTESVDEAYRENEDDYVITYKDSGGENSQLSERIIRITEYQKSLVPIETKDFDSLFLFVDVYLNFEKFALRRTRGTSTETSAGAYATGLNEIVAYVENPDNPKEDENLYHSFSHELVHLLQFARYNEVRGSAYESYNLPRWYMEGMAVYYEFCIPPAQTLTKYTGFESLEEIDEAHLNSDDPSNAYLTSYLFYSYLVEEYGEATVVSLLDLDHTIFYEQSEQILGKSLHNLYNEWSD